MRTGVSGSTLSTSPPACPLREDTAWHTMALTPSKDMKHVDTPNIDCQMTLTTACSSFRYHCTVTERVSVDAARSVHDAGWRRGESLT
jgi:hypothetical protein